MSLPIPQPPGYPVLGNITDIDPEFPVLSLSHLADKYGPIFKLSIFGKPRYFVSSVELCNEVCDEKRFCKSVSGALEEVRNGVGDGLFTAHHGEHNWEIAHRVLVPAFGPLGIKDMFDEMYDIATQLVAKWARMGSDEPIHVTDDYTRLTLDSIALCAMDKRFNSFYSKEMHPFVGAMVGFLVESGRRNRRTRLESMWNGAPQRQYEKDIALMRSVAKEVIAQRRANPVDKKDLLNAMLFGKDPKTGERLTDDNIMNNMITFLIAGHETTSGLLSFTTYLLMKNPEEFRKAQQQVDEVVGKGPVTFQHMSKLPYIEAILRESLRLYPTAPAFTVKAVPGTTGPVIIGGGYQIPAGAPIICVLPKVGRDPAVYGADAEEFRPQRMYGENFEKLPANAWKPFGNGARGCIGRPFAWQEAILVLTLILQNFNLRFDDPSYQMQMKTTLTIKPDNLYMKATLREGIDPVNLEKKMFAGLPEQTTKKSQDAATTSTFTNAKPMTILYGSNAGTCEGLAQSLASAADRHGFHAAVKPLDDASNRLPTKEPVVIITASYEGNPPDNAALFVDWLKNVDAKTVKGAQYAVFGCGHHDWVSTFQKIPKLIDSILSEKGAKTIIERGESDVAKGAVFDDFDAWQDDLLWPALSQSGPQDAVDGLEMEISTSSRASHLHHHVQNALVLKNELLSKPGILPEKRHMEVRLPTNLTYEAGDYLALLPINNLHTISRVLRRFGLPWDATMTLKKGAHTTIPTEVPIAITTVLGAYVELGIPASKKNVATISKFADAEMEEIPNASIVDILEAHPKINLPFSVYLSMLTSMRLRQYSISSSPLADPTIASITYSVLGDVSHLGVATNYLKTLQPGATVQLTIKRSHASFHLPVEDTTTPVIMVAAGTGLAPFRGFVQERAEKIKSSRSVADAVLFIGCRDPEQDVLYGELLEEWQKAGAVKVYYAFSRASEKSEGCKYAQDRVWHERDVVRKMFNEGGRAYICGSGKLGKGVAEVAANIVMDDKKKAGKEITQEEGLKWWEGLRGERFAVDVFD